MKLKKYMLAVLLVLILIGIAYIRALLSDQDRSAQPPSDIMASLPADVWNTYILKEEAAAKIDSLNRIYSDSLSMMRGQWSEASQVKDSAGIDSLEKEIDRLEGKLAEAEKKAKQAGAEKHSQFEKMVAAFYTGEIKRLPDDLSPYEHKVSVEEIKDKAMAYFKISSRELSRIIKKYR